ncbi:MAG: SHOCT domain-containing protein [Chloroflexota bacterium]
MGQTMQPVSLPGGAPLAPGETVLLREQFMLGTLAFYLHTDLALTNRRLYASRPNTMLGLISVGTDRKSFPVDNIAGVEASTRFAIIALILGLVGALVALYAFAFAPILGLLLLAVSVSVLSRSLRQGIAVTNSGGGTILFPVAFIERSRTVEFVNHVAEVMARTAQTPTAPVGLPPQGPRGSDAAAALRNLQDLRDQGLITDVEWSTKRDEILQRL